MFDERERIPVTRICVVADGPDIGGRYCGDGIEVTIG
jgi:hypothetical protein